MDHKDGKILQHNTTVFPELKLKASKRNLNHLIYMYNGIKTKYIYIVYVNKMDN